MSESAAASPNRAAGQPESSDESSSGATAAATSQGASAEKALSPTKTKRGFSYKLGTVGLMLVTGLVAFIGVAALVGSVQQLATDSCSRADGLSCSVPAVGEVPWIEFSVAVVCIGALYLLLRKR